MSKAPKRPPEAEHVVIVTQSVEKKRKNADRHSLELKLQIAQRLKEARQEVGVPEVQDSLSAYALS